MGRPGRFRDATRFKSYAGLAPRASQTGDTDRKGQPMSKAGPSLLRATLFRAADTARRQDPQLARIYHQQMTERGANHLKACCVVAGHLAERAWTVMNRGTPYVICDNNGTPVTAEQARQIIAEKWTVTEEVRKRRRSRKTGGEGPSGGHDRAGQARRPSPPPIVATPRPGRQPHHLTSPPSSARRHRRRRASRPAHNQHTHDRKPLSQRLDRQASIGNQIRPPRPELQQVTALPESLREGFPLSDVRFWEWNGSRS